jgi:prolyl-tRNA synthetase
LAYCADIWSVQDTLKALKITARCIPLDTAEQRGTCMFTGKPDGILTVFAKAY